MERTYAEYAAHQAVELLTICQRKLDASARPFQVNFCQIHRTPPSGSPRGTLGEA